MIEKRTCHVINENTLAYRLAENYYGVLAGSVLRGGPDPMRGPIYTGSLDMVRDATLEDFEFYRVSPKGHMI